MQLFTIAHIDRRGREIRRAHFFARDSVTAFASARTKWGIGATLVVVAVRS